jgi:hypothetical protein
MEAIEAAARLLIQYSDEAWNPLLKQHAADASGHCPTCRSASGASPMWPCEQWLIADKARRLARRQPRQSVES